jgi:hypothetical protein
MNLRAAEKCLAAAGALATAILLALENMICKGVVHRTAEHQFVEIMHAVVPRH